MTQVSPAPSIIGSAPNRQIPSGNGGDGGFSLALGGVERPRVSVPRPAPERPEPEPEARQAVAGTGKDLPDQDELADAEDDRTEADAPFAWFGMTPFVPDAAPDVAAPGGPAIALPEGKAGALLDGLTDPIAAEIAKAIEGFDLAAATPVDIAPEAPVRQVQGIDISRLADSAKIELRADAPALQTLAALAPRSEASPVASLLASAGIKLPEEFRIRNQPETSVAALTPVNGLEMQRAGIVQAVADVQQAAIDTRRADWMTSTIERIEALRDSPNSRETSLKLSPDALGKVDVSIRQEGDRIHVRFSAETAAARTLLTEAQSRLNDIAEARGLKLGGTSVDAGNAGDAGHWGQRQEAAPRTNTVSAPVSALAGETETTDASHGRVA